MVFRLFFINNNIYNTTLFLDNKNIQKKKNNDFAINNTHGRTEIFLFCSTLSEFENFLLCERILINVKMKRQANFKDFKQFGT
jgi:hypothetical protein